MSTVYVIRHGKAGDRSKWDGPDHLRPLSRAGDAQAAALADLLADLGVERVLSSHFARCEQTVRPLADRLGVEIEHSDALVEGASARDAIELLDKIMGETVVVCTHGDVIGNVLDHLARHGVALDDDRMQKG